MIFIGGGNPFQFHSLLGLDYPPDRSCILTGEDHINLLNCKPVLISLHRFSSFVPIEIDDRVHVNHPSRSSHASSSDASIPPRPKRCFQDTPTPSTLPAATHGSTTYYPPRPHRSLSLGPVEERLCHRRRFGTAS